MSEIKPKMVDGEPVCTRFDCPNHLDADEPMCQLFGLLESSEEIIPCVPALRQQRDELKLAANKVMDAWSIAKINSDYEATSANGLGCHGFAFEDIELLEKLLNKMSIIVRESSTKESEASDD